MIKEKFIALQIKNLIKVNVFDKTRKQNVVDARSLFCYILRKDYNFTLYEIRDIFRNNGKKFDHTSVYHNVKLFQEVRKRKAIIEEARNIILSRIDPKYKLLEIIKGIDTDEEIERITNCVNYDNETKHVKTIPGKP